LGALLMTNLLTAHGIRFRFTWRDLFLLPALALGVGLLVLFELQHSSNDLLMWAGLLVLTAGLCRLLPPPRQRSGVLVLHLGLVVMMLSEFVTGVYAVEGTMTLMPGESSSWVDDSHALELAVINRSDPKTDDVISIPASLLRKGATVTHPALPF